MRIHFLGATRTTTGSVYLLELNGQRLLLECGLFQGKRDESIERSRHAASIAIRSIIYALDTSAEQERVVWVRMEDAEASGVSESFMESSITRELQALSSHTVHHFALIAVTLRAHGVQMDPDFGMAPSTLRYLAVKSAEAA